MVTVDRVAVDSVVKLNGEFHMTLLNEGLMNMRTKEWEENCGAKVVDFIPGEQGMCPKCNKYTKVYKLFKQEKLCLLCY